MNQPNSELLVDLIDIRNRAVALKHVTPNQGTDTMLQNLIRKISKSASIEQLETTND